MLPSFDLSQPTFTTGQRLRPSNSQSRSSLLAHQRKRHQHGTGGHAFHNGSGRSKFAAMCTRNRILTSVVIACLLILGLSYKSVFSHGRSETPLQELKREIEEKTGGVATVVPTNTPMKLNIETDMTQPPNRFRDDLLVDDGLPPRDTLTSKRLQLLEGELEQQQAANTKLRLELEAAHEKVRAASASASASTALVSSSMARSSNQNPIEVPSYPPIAIAASKKYSKFYCIGGRGRLGSQNDRSCRFQNLCYAPKKNQWQFFQDPAEKLVVLLDKGVIIEEFPKEFLNARSMGNPQDAQWWSPTIVKSEDGIPSDAFVPRTNPLKPNVNVLYHPHYPSNMGHVIGDDLFPIFNLMSSFGMLVNDAQLILTRDCKKIFANNPKKAEQCDFFLKMLLPGITSRPYLAATQSDFVTQVRGGSSTAADQDLVCFEQLLIGNGPWGFQQSLGKAPAWWSYHAFYLNNLGVNPNRTPKKHRITVSIKKGKRALANNDELVEYLKEKFPTYEIDAIELRSLGGWKKELEYLLDTSILITPCGGVSMSAMFMPHNSALIVVDYFNLKKNVSFGMEERLWTNLGYVRPFHYPFTLDEVEMPPDHKRDDYQEMRDWGQVRVNMERMETIVRSAISHVDNFMVFGQS